MVMIYFSAMSFRNYGGFYNTGIYEEIHPADFWIRFVTDNGLTREYFDVEIKEPLSAVMKLYQKRTLDKQSDFTGFISDTSNGLAGMVAGNAFYDLLLNYAGDLASFPAYLDLVKILKGTATDENVDELVTILTGYIGQYDDYETKLGQAPSISETEFEILKENLPKLVKVISPFLIADAVYTQNTFGEDYSLYYTYTLVDNAENLVIGHIPESIMPILKSLIPKSDEEDIKVPDSGSATMTEQGATIDVRMDTTVCLVILIFLLVTTLLKKSRVAKHTFFVAPNISPYFYIL